MEQTDFSATKDKKSLSHNTRLNLMTRPQSSVLTNTHLNPKHHFSRIVLNELKHCNSKINNFYVAGGNAEIIGQSKATSSGITAGMFTLQDYKWVLGIVSKTRSIPPQHSDR